MNHFFFLSTIFLIGFFSSLPLATLSQEEEPNSSPKNLSGQSSLPAELEKKISKLRQENPAIREAQDQAREAFKKHQSVLRKKLTEIDSTLIPLFQGKSRQEQRELLENNNNLMERVRQAMKKANEDEELLDAKKLLDEALENAHQIILKSLTPEEAKKYSSHLKDYRDSKRTPLLEKIKESEEDTQTEASQAKED